MPNSSDPAKTPPHPLLRKSDIERLPETTYRHPLNPDAVRHTRPLAKTVGMSRLGVNLVRLEPGGESTEYHFHHNKEEFVYILSGRGEAEIGDERHEVAAGDFMGFSARSLPHTMRNPFDEELVYLVGGQSLSDDVTEYPRAGKLMYRVRGERHVVKMEHIDKL